MLGSTLLTVGFVPSVFVVMQRLEEWRERRKASRNGTTAHAATP
jgi:HAE1 family hydrophobic/amphiphilic exporter-1